VSGNVVVRDGRVVVEEERAPGDALAHEALAVMLSAVASGERGVPVGVWVSRLGGWGGPRVLERLVRDGRWCRVVGRAGRWGRGGVSRVVPVEGESVCAGVCLGRALCGVDRASWPEVLAAGLVVAAGLGPVVPELGAGGVRVEGLVSVALAERLGVVDRSGWARERAVAGSGLEVLQAVTVLVGDAVLSART
jgi:hypothetical protein